MEYMEVTQHRTAYNRLWDYTLVIWHYPSQRSGKQLVSKRSMSVCFVTSTYLNRNCKYRSMHRPVHAHCVVY